jgi:tripartite-type tricarboxylate transporter receptor subunit TctC
LMTAPAGVSPDVPRMLVPAIEKVVRDPAIAAKLATLGIIAEWAPGEKVAAEIREGHRTLEEIAKKAGLVK